jgi:hypothetical protein
MICKFVSRLDGGGIAGPQWRKFGGWRGTAGEPSQAEGKCKRMRCARMLVVLVAVLATASAAFGQVKKPNPASSQPASKPPLKLRLLDIGSVTPGGPSKRARPAAKFANQKSAKQLESNDSGVSELRAVSEPAGGTLVLPPGSSKAFTAK